MNNCGTLDYFELLRIYYFLNLKLNSVNVTTMYRTSSGVIDSSDQSRSRTAKTHRTENATTTEDYIFVTVLFYKNSSALMMIRAGWETESTMCRTPVVLSPCRQHSCQNNATCVDLNSQSYTCLCSAKYTGNCYPAIDHLYSP